MGEDRARAVLIAMKIKGKRKKIAVITVRSHLRDTHGNGPRCRPGTDSKRTVRALRAKIPFRNVSRSRGTLQGASFRAGRMTDRSVNGCRTHRGKFQRMRKWHREPPAFPTANAPEFFASNELTGMFASVDGSGRNAAFLTCAHFQPVLSAWIWRIAQRERTLDVVHFKLRWLSDAFSD